MRNFLFPCRTTYLSIACFLFLALLSAPQSVLAQSFKPGLDKKGKIVIFATPKAAKLYSKSIVEIRKIHPGQKGSIARIDNRNAILKVLRKEKPRYVIWFITPSELDLLSVWSWLDLSSKVDSDPFVDVRTGFITGLNPQSTEKFVKRIVQAATGKLTVPAKFLDDLGPNRQLPDSGFTGFPGSWFLKSYQAKLSGETISHGNGGYPNDKLDKFTGAGIIHFGGHGYPDGIDNGLKYSQLDKVKLSPSVVFNGACYTGVTNRWYRFLNTIQSKSVKSENSFCLNLLDNNVLAYFAATSADHGIPVYQEMEYAMFSGTSLGDIIKSTQDGLTIARGGKAWKFPSLANNQPRPKWTPSDFMLYGTASRVLFGDPSLHVFNKRIEEPFDYKISLDSSGRTKIEAVVKNASLKSWFTNTYASNLSAVKNLFNDRIYLKIPFDSLPKESFKGKIVSCKMRGALLKLVGSLIEEDQGQKFLHLQIDVQTSAYMRGPLRKPGAKLTLLIE